jgi:hypothetical protein
VWPFGASGADLERSSGVGSERPSDAMFGKGRESAFALRNLQTPRGAYIAVRNEATQESLLSERVAARTRK